MSKFAGLNVSEPKGSLVIFMNWWPSRYPNGEGRILSEPGCCKRGHWRGHRGSTWTRETTETGEACLVPRRNPRKRGGLIIDKRKGRRRAGGGWAGSSEEVWEIRMERSSPAVQESYQQREGGTVDNADDQSPRPKTKDIRQSKV
jgi:hypothetical protein